MFYRQSHFDEHSFFERQLADNEVFQSVQRLGAVVYAAKGDGRVSTCVLQNHILSRGVLQKKLLLLKISFYGRLCTKLNFSLL